MDDADGHYIGRDNATNGRDIWWSPPGGAPTERLPRAGARSPDGPNWGYVGSGPLDAAESILLHSTGDPRQARTNAKSFCADVLARHATDSDLDLPAQDVESWLRGRGIPLAPGWGPAGPQPVVEWTRRGDDVERYTVALDGWDVLQIDVGPNPGHARVSVTDLTHDDELSWSRRLATVDEGVSPATGPPGGRVRSEPLPFGGWAVQIDGSDVVVLERDRTTATQARVSVYDRTLESGFLVFDEAVQYRQLPAEPTSIGERLRVFTGNAGRDRVLGR